MIIIKSHEIIPFISRYLTKPNPLIVEAGAFDGKDTLKMTAQWPEATIHVFEPVPEIYNRLVDNTQHNAHIQRYPYALSSTNGTEIFYIEEKPTKPGIACQAGSLHKPKDRLRVSPIIFPRTTTVTTITLTHWAEQNNIEHIDVLWLDTQGHELELLMTAETFLPHITIIVTEVAFIESYENIPLYHELVSWLEHQGFTAVGRDFEDSTKSFFGNVIFVRLNH